MAKGKVEILHAVLDEKKRPRVTGVVKAGENLPRGKRSDSRRDIMGKDTVKERDT